MDTPTLITPLHVLDRILALNLDISLWSARTKLTEEDFGGAELPPGRPGFPWFKENL